MVVMMEELHLLSHRGPLSVSFITMRLPFIVVFVLALKQQLVVILWVTRSLPPLRNRAETPSCCPSMMGPPSWGARGSFRHPRRIVVALGGAAFFGDLPAVVVCAALLEESGSVTLVGLASGIALAGAGGVGVGWSTWDLAGEDLLYSAIGDSSAFGAGARSADE